MHDILVLPINEKYTEEHIEFLADSIREAVTAVKIADAQSTDENCVVCGGNRCYEVNKKFHRKGYKVRKVNNYKNFAIFASLRVNKNIMNKLKFALIGTGGIAQTYAQAFQTSDCCEFVAVADVNEDSAKAFAEPFGAKAFCGLQNSGGKFEIDAVIVSTPPNSHPEIAMFFMNIGKHVLCEKPLCLSVAEAKQMIETAEKTGVKFHDGVKVSLLRRCRQSQINCRVGHFGRSRPI